MPVLDNRKLEAFAQALARGMQVDAASKEAGYSYGPNHARRRKKWAKVVERVDEIIKERKGGGSPDIRPLIDLLVELAEQAKGATTGVILREARALIVEAARLKALLPDEANPAWAPPIPELDLDEWMARFGQQTG